VPLPAAMVSLFAGSAAFETCFDHFEYLCGRWRELFALATCCARFPAMKPLGITLGDPSGVGPEVTCKALATLPSEARDGIVVIGSYHPSQQNTFTGRLPEEMLDDVFRLAKGVIEKG